ncbi:Gti1/Pac2 family-domain-containing protein [Aspergillus ambiguus]|uniref:camp independent regulatory protein n=1 Tax=Aspergillus ambiguus TaxID=176160 RepID=UPI003CCC9A36
METYYGHVRTPADAIILFEACRIGLLPRVQRRLSEKERQLIRSGSVFVWDEREAGMRRWTDGKSWSASRVSGSFLTYREMEGKRGGSGVSQAAIPRAGKTPESTRGSDDDRADGPDEGPDGYRYKPDGLMKQSFSITTSAGQHLHLISYYSRSHPSAANLQQPTNDPSLRHVRPQKGLYPESTVNDQQNLPVVTRGPMGGAYSVPHPMPPYARAGATHPQSYTPPYAWPPTPLATPPVAVHYSPYLPPVSGANGPLYAHHPHQQQQQQPPPPPPPSHGLPPPPPPQPGLSAAYDPPAHHPIESSIHASGVQHPSLPVIAGRSPRLVADARDLHQRSPPAYSAAAAAAAAAADPRRASPRSQPPAIPPTNGYGAAARSPVLLNQPPPSSASSSSAHIPPPKLLADAGASSGTTVPGISSLMNGTSAGGLPSITAPGGPPGSSVRGDGPRDIPSEKIGFGGEDMRALRQLDRVFTA